MSIGINKKDIFLRFVSYLEQQKILYCVVGDARKFPNQIDSDVDIVIPEKLSGDSSRLVNEFARVAGVQLVQQVRHERNAWSFTLYWNNCDGVAEFIQLDICGDYLRSGKLYLKAEILLCGREKAKNKSGGERGFYVPAPEKELLFYLLKKVSKGKISVQQIQHLKEEYFKSPEASELMLRNFWADEDVRRIVSGIKSSDVNSMLTILPQLKKGMKRRERISLRNIIGEFVRLVGRVMRPTGLMVVMLGPDGVGKSSVGDGVFNTQKAVFSGQQERIHLRPRIIKRKDSGSRDSVTVTDPYADESRGGVASSAKIIFFLFDYIVGYLLVVWPLLVRNGFVIFDRYYYDLFLDPRRYRYGGKIWLARFAGHFVPKPDLIIVFDASVDVIHARKQEVTAEQTELQRFSYRKFSEHEKNCSVINAEQPIEQVVRDVNQVILGYLVKRNNKRFG